MTTMLPALTPRPIRPFRHGAPRASIWPAVTSCHCRVSIILPLCDKIIRILLRTTRQQRIYRVIIRGAVGRLWYKFSLNMVLYSSSLHA